MTGGIYCEVPLGTIFGDKPKSIDKRLHQFFGITPQIDKSLTQQTIDALYKDVSTKMSKVLSSWRVPTNRGYYNRTVDLTRSICMGVYKDKKLRRMYRFTGGHPEAGASRVSEWGTSPSQKDQVRMWHLKKYHPDPAQRAMSFLNGYELLNTKGYVVVIAATMPYAVTLESKYYLSVLGGIIPRVIKNIIEIRNGDASGMIYGYIFEDGSFDMGQTPLTKGM